MKKKIEIGDNLVVFLIVAICSICISLISNGQNNFTESFEKADSTFNCTHPVLIDNMPSYNPYSDQPYSPYYQHKINSTKGIDETLSMINEYESYCKGDSVLGDVYYTTYNDDTIGVGIDVINKILKCHPDSRLIRTEKEYILTKSKLPNLHGLKEWLKNKQK